MTGPTSKRGLLKRLVTAHGPDFAGLTNKEGVRNARLRIRGQSKMLALEGQEEALDEVQIVPL